MEQLALGELGMDVDSFYDLTPRQFNNKVIGHYARIEFLENQEWQRARLISFYAIKGHDSKNRLKQPKALFALPGDKKEKKQQSAPMTKEQALALAQKWK